MQTTPEPSERDWVLYEPTWVGDEEDPERATGPWSGHRWFAYDLVRWARPRRIVELGTHYGVSFFAFAQAVRDGGLETEVHAVDTWKGDPHAGFYEGVYEHVERIVQVRFEDVDTHLHRCTFDEALERFEDGSVDLLHIDGFHSYEAAKHDLDTWLPKLAENGIVLMHDVAPDSGYGSTQHWEEEVASRYPSFRFEHYFGLGVALPKGTDAYGYLLTDEFQRWRRYYEHRAMRRLGEQQYRDQARMIDDRDEALAAAQRQVDDRDEALAATERLVSERDEALRAATVRVADLEEAVAAQADLIDARDEAVQAQARLIDERDEALAEHARRVTELERSLATAEERALRLEADLGDALARVRDVVSELRQLEASWYHASDDRPALSEPVEDAPSAPAAPPIAESTTEPGFVERAREVVPAPAAEALASLQRRWWSLRDYLRWREETRARAVLTEPFIETDVLGGRSRRAAAVRYEREWAAEGRDPRARFSTAFYCGFSGVLPEAGPFHHFLRSGLAAGLPGDAAALSQLVRNPYAAGGEVLTWVGWHRRPDQTEAAVQSSSDVPLDEVDLLTFDVWDTLIERTRAPESVKLCTAAWLCASDELAELQLDRWALYRARVEAESALAHDRATADGFGEYSAQEALAAALSRLAPGLDEPTVDRLAREAVTAEVADECEHTRPRREWVDLLRRALDDDVRVAVVSDFYLHAADLAAVLRSCGVPLDGVDVHVSVEAGVSKAAGGRLLDAVRGEVPAARHLHVGDSEPADVLPQLAAGGAVVHVARSPLTALQASGVLEPGSLGRSLVPVVRAVRSGADRSGGALPTNAEDLDQRRRAIRRDAGAELAQLAVPIVWSAACRADELATRRVVYLSREGETLAHLHGLVAETLGVAHIEAVHVPLSRRLTFGPAVADDLATGLDRLRRTYRGQSVRELLGSLGLRVEDVAVELGARGLAPDSVPDPDDALDLLRDGPLGTRVRAHLSVQRARARSYLAEVLGGAEVVVLADVGWRGTIQDNLTAIEPDRLFHGTYLALLPFVWPQPANGGKFAVGPDANLGGDTAALESRVAVIERMLSSDAPASTRFTRSVQGAVEIERRATSPRSGGLVDVRAGLLAAGATTAAALRASGLGPHDTQAYVEAALERLLLDPAPALADAVLAQEQVEDFGALGHHDGHDLESLAREILRTVARGGTPAPPSSAWPEGAAALSTVVSAREAFAG